MPNIPQPQRQDEPVMTDSDLAALLAGMTDAAAGLRPVADVLAALTAEPTVMELAGEARALAEFRRRAGAPVPSHRARRGTAGLSSRFGVKVGASVTAAAIVLGGGAAAAYAGVLPAPIQRLAHEAIGAPIPAPRHALPSRGRPAHVRPGVYGRSGVHGKTAPRGGPGTSRQARPHPTPHPTPTPTAHGNPQGGQGNHGKQGKGQGNEGQGHQGSGQVNQGSGEAHRASGQEQASRQGQDKAPARQGNPHKKRPHGNSQANRRLAWHPRRSVRIRLVMEWSVRTRPVMQALSSRPVPRPGCGVAAARWAGWPA